MVCSNRRFEIETGKQINNITQTKNKIKTEHDPFGIQQIAFAV
jgi:hypothetical protein